MSLSRRPLLLPSPNSATPSPSLVSPVSSGFDYLWSEPSFQSAPQAYGASLKPGEAPFSFELLSLPPADEPSPAFVPAAPAGLNPSLRVSRSVAEHRLSTSSSKSEPFAAAASNPDDQFRPPRSRSAREPRMPQSKSWNEQNWSTQRLEVPTQLEVPPSTLELSKAALRPQSSLRKRSDSLDSAVLRPPFDRSGSVYGSGRRDPGKRFVFINNPEKTNERYEYAGNKVRTSKYTLLSFLPRNLFEQFHRVAYIYFLVIVILNQIPQLAVFGRTASLFPLLFVLIVTAIKDAYEDWRRHRSDSKENNRLALVFQDGEFREKRWKHIQVGEMIKVQANETIPCDIVLLSTSDTNGGAFVQTINLDGESNLKTRYALQETAARHEEHGVISGTVICEIPDRNIYGFVASMEFDKRQLPLGPTNIILRGCELKNTSWVVGVVVYAGRETKAMLNSSGAQSKRSRLEQIMNRETLWLSFFLFIICFVGGLGLGLWLDRHEKQLNTLPYYRKKYLSNWKDYNYYGKFGESILAFLSFVIMFQIMIPISLYISMELVRVGQSFFMIRDNEMYHESSNSRFQCRALNINEDLGQVKYVFSDKTGTLTENKMEFRNASICGVNYNNPKAIVEPAGNIEGSIRQEDKHLIEEVLGKQTWKPKVGVKVDPKLMGVLQGSHDSLERKTVHDYLLTLAACNTIVPTKVKTTLSGKLEMEVAHAADDGFGLVEYQGESPDEQALVSAAASYGYTLLERTSNHVVIDVLGEIQQYEVLGMHEFDSVRKCMSVVLQCPDMTVKVLVKGADASVLEKIAQPAGGKGGVDIEGTQQDDLLTTTCKHLNFYANEGLRTLVIAMKDLSGLEFKEWQRGYAEASNALDDRVGMLREVAKVVEKDLMLLGATGIEDKLQHGVPEAIAALREAGMKVWVLTGDKQETAISIGFSCALLTNEMKQIIINESDKGKCRTALTNAKAANGIMTERRRSFLRRQNSIDVRYGVTLQDPTMSGELFSASQPHATLSDSLSKSIGDSTVSMDPVTLQRSVTSKGTSQPLALIIDGNSLVHALGDDLEQELFDLATACKVVLCCRVAPLQKAGIVSLVKRKSREMTLAIGDGANDVSMIQMADVGVGISGQEGRQAVMASDFAMGQFRYLKRLLLVHGHWNYFRLGYMVLYNFYRNAVFVMMLFWYILHTAFSPFSAITDWSLVFYSLIYTSVPTIVVGILDKDVSNKTLLKYPSLYGVGQRGESYNSTLFWLTMLDTLWQSLVLFYVPFFTYKNSTMDAWGIGSIWTMAVVVLVNVHLAMDTLHWTWISHAAIWGSTAATFICLLVLDVITLSDFLPHYWVIFHMIQKASYWFDILFIVCLALLPRFLVKVVKQHFWPSDVQIARESEILTWETPDQNNVGVTADAA